MVFNTGKNQNKSKMPGGFFGKTTIDDATLNHMIQERAYYIWEEKGKPEGRDTEIWAQAEKDIRRRYGKR